MTSQSGEPVKYLDLLIDGQLNLLAHIDNLISKIITLFKKDQLPYYSLNDSLSKLRSHPCIYRLQ